MDKWIYEPPSESEDEFKSNDLTFMLTGATDTPTYNGVSPALRTKKKKRKGKKGGGGGGGEEEEEEEDDEDEEMAKVCT